MGADAQGVSAAAGRAQSCCPMRRTQGQAPSSSRQKGPCNLLMSAQAGRQGAALNYAYKKGDGGGAERHPESCSRRQASHPCKIFVTPPLACKLLVSLSLCHKCDLSCSDSCMRITGSSPAARVGSTSLQLPVHNILSRILTSLPAYLLHS